MVRVLVGILFLAAVSCSQKVSVRNGQFDTISGAVTGLSTSSLNSTLSSCTSETVKLYSLNDNGAEGELIAEAVVKANGQFTFNGLISKGVKVGPQSQHVQYLLRFSCGSEVLNRYVTGSIGQNVDYGTTLLSWFSYTNESSKLKDIPTASWTQLYDQLQGATSVEDAYATVLANTTIAENVATSGLDVGALNDAAPILTSTTVPATFNEEVSNIVSALAHHWSPTYSMAYEWRMNGQLLSTSISYNYIPTANSQGTYSLQFFVGKNNGSGNIDTSKPYVQKVFAVTVANSVLPVAPAFILTTSATTNSQSHTVRVNTGAVSGSTFANCRSFSTFAIVDDSAVSAALPPPHSEFIHSCSTANLQDIPVTSTGVQGPRVWRIWSLDASGTVSSAPQEVHFTYDTTAPALAITSPAVNSEAQTGVTLAGTCETGLTVTINGSGVSSTTATCSSGTFSTAVSFTSGEGSKSISVSQEDAAGNAGSDSRAFVRDNTNPTITITAPVASFNAQTGVTLTGACESDLAVTASGPVSAATTTCSSGSYSLPLTFTGGDGTKAITVTQTDTAGNIGAASRSFVKDSTAPVLTITAPAVDSSAPTSITLTGACENGLTVTIDGAGAVSTTTTCASSSYSGAVTFSSGDGTKTISVHQTDAAGNTTTVSRDFIKDSVSPAMNSIVINNGDASTSSAFINIAARATDSLSENVYFKFGLANTGTESCQTEFVDSGWSTGYSSGATHALAYTLSAVDGVKKICAWVKDAAGNISVTSPAIGTEHTDFDKIDFFVGNSPVITQFEVMNNSTLGNSYSTGDIVRVNWTVTDVEGLSANPIVLEYTTNNSDWTTILNNYGSLSGNPTSYTHTYTGWSVPAGINTSFFRLRLRAIDASGNSSVMILSSPQNTNNWTVFAGSSDRGVGGNATALSLKMSWPTYSNQVAFDPSTNDMYVADADTGIIKISAATGATSYFIRSGTANLSSSGGTLPALPTMPMTRPQVIFDKNGLLYVRTQSNDSQNSSRLHQIDLQNMTSRIYLGANAAGTLGTVTDGTGSWSTTFQGYDGMAFDNNNNLYFFSYCRGNASAVTSTQSLLLKLSQNSSDKSPGTITNLAGSCSAALNAAPTSFGGPALGQSFYAGSMGNMSVAPNADGSVVYLRRDTNILKIINGNLYQTSLGSSSGSTIAFNQDHSKLVLSSNGFVRECIPNFAGANGEVCSNLTSYDSAPNCTDDGQHTSTACIYSRTQVGYTKQGNIFFVDNAQNTSTAFRVRYIDSESKIRTLAGSIPLYGDGLQRNLMKGGFSSIYYKKASELESVAYPEGLYFTTDSIPVFGHIHPTTHQAQVLWGNQIPVSGITTGIPTTKYQPMGAPSSYSAGTAMTFGSDGLPTFILDNMLYTLDSSKRATRHSSTSSSVNWDTLAPTDNPATTAHRIFMIQRHGFMTKHAGSAFFLGSSWDPNSGINTQEYPSLRYHNYVSSPTTLHIAGASGTTNGAAVTTAGDIRGVSIASNCQGSTQSCSFTHVENGPGDADDVIYYNAGTLVRKITNPFSPTNATLTNVFTSSSSSMAMTVSPNGKRLFYVATNGLLYCHSFSAVDITSWCPQSAHPSLGPSAGLRTFGSPQPGMLTWKDDDHLFLANGPEIYLYTLPNGTP